MTDIPSEAWERVGPERAEALMKGCTELYGEPLYIYGAEHEDIVAVVVVWRGPIFMSFVSADGDKHPHQFDDEWGEMAKWHSALAMEMMNDPD